MTTAELQKQAKDLIETVHANKYLSPFDVTSDKLKVFFSVCLAPPAPTLLFVCNVASNPPTKELATAYLYEMEEHYHRLHAASDTFRTFMEGKKVCFELEVFSGHMNFPVATYPLGGKIKWYITL